jgi:hypothetical protein
VGFFLVAAQGPGAAVGEEPRHEAETVEWELVGIDPELIDPDLVE